MKSNWKKYTFDDICTRIYSGGTPSTKKSEYWNGSINWLSSGETKNKYIHKTERKITEFGVTHSSTQKAHVGDTVVASAGQGYTRGQASYLTIDTYINQSVIVFNANSKIVDKKFLYFNLDNRYDELRQLSDGTSTRGGLSCWIVKKMEINLPPLETQKKIASILSALDDKIELNNKINENLEMQAQAIFKSWFGADIDRLNPNNCKSLSELVTTIDNRGKTPPLSNIKTKYPIIDVRALSGSSRIIDFSNCTKYVEEETYNSWFRNGHPKDYDILISTVGSLAEMKIYLGNIGCIAQNVVGFRSKGLSSIYLYQYLNYIRNELASYNIGSVQPSIKVTHIIKHPIFIPEYAKIDKFDLLVKGYTLKIYKNCCENQRLAELRDTLLPKLMNGEIDVDDVQVKE